MISKEEFIRKAIESNRKPPYKGVPVSQILAGMEEYYGGEASDFNAKSAMAALERAGKVVIGFSRRNDGKSFPIAYLPEEKPEDTQAVKFLSTVGLSVNQAKKMPQEQFVLECIKKYTTQSKYNGLHVVYSGFNKAFEKVYGEKSQVTVDLMAKTKKIFVRPAKGGPVMYLPENSPAKSQAREFLARMGL